MGSWPLPPPDTSPTLPFLGASLRMITFGSYSTRIRSACAAAIPAMASLTSVSGVLINFLSRVVTDASAIAASSYYLCPDGNVRRKMNLPMPFPITNPTAIATRLIASASKRRVRTASSTALIASPLPPMSRMRFSRSSRDRVRGGRADEAIGPRPPFVLLSCRFSCREEDIELAARSRPLRHRLGHVRTDRDGQVLVYHKVVDPGAQRATDQRHQGRDPDVEVRPGDGVRAVADQQHPEPGPEVTGRVQGGHLDRREEPDERRHDDTDRQRCH